MLPNVFNVRISAVLPDDPTEQAAVVSELIGGYSRYVTSLSAFKDRVKIVPNWWVDQAGGGKRKPRAKAPAQPEAELPLEQDEEERYEVEHGGPTFDEP
jgi:hypothetical protein